MKNKIKILAAAAVVSIATVASALTRAQAQQQRLDSGDYAGFGVNILAADTNLLTKSNYIQIYEATLQTNVAAASRVAWLTSLSKLNDELVFSHIERYLDLDTSVYAVMQANNLNYTRALSIYKTLYDQGKKAEAIYGICAGMNIPRLKSAAPETIELYNRIVSREVYDSIANTKAWYFVIRLALAMDTVDSYYDARRTSEIADYGKIESNINMFNHYINCSPKSPCIHRILDICVKRGAISFALNSAKRLDQNDGTNEYAEWLYENRSSEMDWTTKFNLAKSIGSDDKTIDLFLTIDDAQSADTIDWFIKFAVKLDVTYRSSDMLKVLKNINAKYTLKLYDERDKWEPILSKIRAMIDVR